MTKRPLTKLTIASACLIAVATGSASGPTTQAGPGPGKCMMWTAKSKTATVYIVGSIHLGRSDMYPLPKEMEEAFAKADLLVEEVKDEDDSAVFGDDFFRKTQYPLGDKLTNHLTSDQWKDVKAACESVGLSTELAESSKPGMVCFGLGYFALKRGAVRDDAAVQKRGLIFALGIDHHFVNAANDRKLPIEGIETAEFQSEAFLQWVDQVPVEHLMNAVSGLNRRRAATATQPTDDGVDEIVRRWVAGDAAAEACSLQQSVRNTNDCPPLDLYRIDERNARMAEKVKSYLGGDKTAFVVVGCAHVVGEKGVVQRLRDDHIEIVQSPGTTQATSE